MKKYTQLFVGFIIVGLIAFGFHIYSQQTNKITITGLLDGTDSLSGVNAQYRHQFHAWGGDSQNEVTKIVQNIEKSNSKVLLTVEPWPTTGDGEMFANILKGKYDTIIQSVCDPLKKTTSPVLRWGHEMETVGSRYPWASKDAQGYVSAFQYVHDYCKTIVPQVKFMWSPAGLDGLNKYYPGDKYVDYIGLSIFGYPEYEQKTQGKKQTMNEILMPRYNRLVSYYKPVILAEFSCAGDTDYKNNWLQQGIKDLKSVVMYPRIEGFVFFSGGHVDPWIDGISAPDFSLTADQAQTLLAKANTLERVK